MAEAPPPLSEDAIQGLIERLHGGVVLPEQMHSGKRIIDTQATHYSCSLC
jgi:DeoR/GlpR family transcriptional regulator of sugar metabolism